MTSAVTFDPGAFIAAFPEFASCSTAQTTGWFQRATLVFENNTCNPAYGDGNMAALFNLLVAHIGWLNAPRDPSGNPAATGSPYSAVGRINSGNEGSVSVGLDMGDSNASSPSQAWYMQTKYGAEFWAATVQYRGARWAPGPIRNFQPVFPYWAGRRW